MSCKETARRRRKELHEQGLCARCREPLGRNRLDRMYCNMCKATLREYKAIRLDRCPEARERNRIYQRERRARLIEEHRCVICGQELEEGRALQKCVKCTEKYGRKKH